MKVLVAHNRYRSAAPSGENRVVDAEIAALARRNVEAVSFLAESDEIEDTVSDKLNVAVGAVLGGEVLKKFERLLDNTRPDVVHMHNVFPLLTPKAFESVRTRRIPLVLTMHNYRLGCINGQHFRNHQQCVKCLGRAGYWPGVIHACYRQSRAQSLVLATSQTLHRQAWNSIDQFIALTPFMRDYLLRLSVPSRKVVVRPSWVPDPGIITNPGRHVVFLGRLEEAKGLRLLIDAWRLVQGGTRRLLIAGGGPLENFVREAAASCEDVEYLGNLKPAEVSQLLVRAGVIVVPSLWYEGFPMSVVEAFAMSRPVIVMAGSSAASVIDGQVGWKSQPSASGLSEVIRSITDDDISKRAAGARRRFLKCYSEKVAMSSLVELYSNVCVPKSKD